ncbi:MAG: serine/threonine protein kinase [Planctomycetota bacterium]|nr:MAG: serine/threonine protein kinase [Planctomycetota bacterium]
MQSPSKSPDPRRIQELFLAAADLPQEEQREYLQRHTGGDRELMEEVLSLLGFDQQSADWDQPLLQVAPIWKLEDGEEISQAWAPDTLGKYQILQTLARGGMGTVFRARQPEIDREVALKALHHDMVTPVILRRFELEVQILGQLDHPGIARIYDAGTARQDGRSYFFYAMELVRGTNLLEYATRKDLQYRDRLRLFLKVCEAVDHAHKENILHRDLKPANIMVNQHGAAKILDFGVARILNQESPSRTFSTTPGVLIGTLAYMSPEQAAGGTALDFRTDVYSLGAILFEMVFGYPYLDLHDLPIPEAIHKIQQGRPKFPSVSDSGEASSLLPVLHKALAVDPGLRYPSAGSLAQDLARLLEGKPTQARLPSRRIRWSQYVARHPVMATLIACSIILISTLVLTLASVHFLARVPHYFVINKEARYARLRTRSGHDLRAWDFEQHGEIVDGVLIREPGLLQGEKVLAIAHGEGCADPKLNGKIALYHMDDLDQPYWTSASHPMIPPGGRKDRKEVKELAEFVHAWDIFPELPGQEILAVETLSPYSPSVIRIFDLKGKLLFEEWHNGALFSAAWWASNGTVVFAGVNSEGNWIRRGYPSNGKEYPAVVFAIKPELGKLEREQWMVKDQETQLDSVLWYRWLGPPELLQGFRGGSPLLTVGQGHTVKDKLTFRYNFQFDYEAGSERVAFHFTLNSRGETTSRYTGEDYRAFREQGLVADFSEFKLLDYSVLPKVRTPQ